MNVISCKENNSDTERVSQDDELGVVSPILHGQWRSEWPKIVWQLCHLQRCLALYNIAAQHDEVGCSLCVTMV